MQGQVHKFSGASMGASGLPCEACGFIRLLNSPCHISMDSTQGLKSKWQAEQQILKSNLVLTDDPNSPWPPHLVGGLDISFDASDQSKGVACLAVLSYEDMNVVYESFVEVSIEYPYESGFLAFREVPSYQTLIERVRRDSPLFTPDIVLVDGAGILHPQQFGSASHLGVSASIPTIGVAKKLLQIEGIDKETVQKALRDERSTIGEKSSYALLHSTRSSTPVGAAFLPSNVKNPIFISQGHNISLERSISLVSRFSLHRVPEPIRQADIRSREYLRLQRPEP